MESKRTEWVKNNLDKIALASRRYYEKMKDDPIFIAKKRAYALAARERQRKAKALLPIVLPQEEKQLNHVQLLSCGSTTAKQLPNRELLNHGETTAKPVKKLGRPRKY